MFYDPQKLLILTLLSLTTSGAAQSQVPLSISTPLLTNVTGIPQGVGGGSGQSCDPRKSVLDGLTHRFRSDCNATEWCSPTPVGSQAVSQPLKPQPPPVSSPSSQEEDDEGEDDPNDLMGKRKHSQETKDGDQQVEVNAKNGKDGSSSVKHSKPQPQPYDPARRDAPPLPSTTSGAPVNLPTMASPVPHGAVPTTGICVPKKCRRDEYPFGYKGVPAAELPPLCGPGTYCPDEESGCKPLIPLGGSCQLNRDDSCAQSAGSMIPPRIGTTEPMNPNTVFSRSQRMISSLLRSRQIAFSTRSSPSAKNVDDQFSSTSSNSSIAKPLCLGGTCRLASATLGSVCIIDHTQYLGYDQNGQEVADVVSRDDCRDALYCDSQSFTCMKEKEIGERCKADTECLEYNCSDDGYCDPPPEAPNKVPGWAFGLIGVAISLVIITIVTILYKVHLNHRAIRSDEIDRYFSEQWTYRQSILAMHAAAVSSAAEDEQAQGGNGKSELHSRKGYGYVSDDSNEFGKSEMEREDSDFGYGRKREKDESGYESDQSEATTILTPTNANNGRFVERSIHDHGPQNNVGLAARRKPPPTF